MSAPILSRTTLRFGLSDVRRSGLASTALSEGRFYDSLGFGGFGAPLWLMSAPILSGTTLRFGLSDVRRSGLASTALSEGRFYDSLRFGGFGAPLWLMSAPITPANEPATEYRRKRQGTRKRATKCVGSGRSGRENCHSGAVVFFASFPLQFFRRIAMSTLSTLSANRKTGFPTNRLANGPQSASKSSITDGVLRELSKNQLGVFTVAQARKMGVGHRSIQRREHNGQIVRCHGGVYRNVSRTLRPVGFL
jgi:hypothetical protein